MRKKTMELLIKLGIPMNIKRFYYICDAMEIYEQDESFITSKTCRLYEEITDDNDTYPSRVERCMRHAFEKVVYGGNLDLLSGFKTDTQSPTNGNLLACLYLTLKEL